MKKDRKKNKKLGFDIFSFGYPENMMNNRDNDNDFPEEREEIDEPVKVNEIYIQAFIEEFQPESDEQLEDVRALSMGELRDILQIYRTYDSKSPDPLPYYLPVLANYGFKVKMGFSGEQVILVSRRNNGRAKELK